MAREKEAAILGAIDLLDKYGGRYDEHDYTTINYMDCISPGYTKQVGHMAEKDS
ncbi:hypothetical protein NYE70_17815 [Paenibacillus sp. FSL R5-0407]|uniref:hypothetical protein n=1 Tax=Paenibacillus sp. FSL R5-0407 TaxID=2975320 RepID=UPI0030F55BFA